MTYFIAELMGTLFLILLGNGVVANVVLKDTKGNNGGWMVITSGWAFAVFIGVVVANQLGSGAHLNPAVTVGFLVKGDLDVNLALPYISGQMLGAMIGAFLVWVMYKDHFDITPKAGDKLACFSTGPAIKNPLLNFFSEVIGTFTLLFVIFSFVSSDSAMIGNLGGLPVTILVWAIGLSLGGTTGYAINSARDIGPRIVHTFLYPKANSEWGYAWVPAFGPLVGGALAALLFNILN